MTQEEEDALTTEFEIAPGGNGIAPGGFTQPVSHTEEMTTSVPGHEGVGSGMGETVTEAQDPTGDPQDTTKQPLSMEDTTFGKSSCSPFYFLFYSCLPYSEHKS